MAQQVFSNGYIMDVTCGKLNVYRIPECINDCMYLGAASASTYSDALVLVVVLGIRFPFFEPLRWLCAL